MTDDRLQALMRDLDVDDVEQVDPAARERAVDPFFTARVLDALPSRLAFTGLTPLQRATLLGAAHALALGAAWFVLSSFVPTWLGSVAEGAHGLLEQSAAVSWPWGLLAVAVVGAVAFAAARSHTSAA